MFLNIAVGLMNLSKDSLVTSLRVYDSTERPDTSPLSGYGQAIHAHDEMAHAETAKSSICCWYLNLILYIFIYSQISTSFETEQTSMWKEKTNVLKLTLYVLNTVNETIENYMALEVRKFRIIVFSVVLLWSVLNMWASYT